LIQESIHIVFDEATDSHVSSSPFQQLKLSRYDDDDEEEEEARAKANKEHHDTCHNLPPLNDEPQTTNAKESPSNDLNEDVTHEEGRGYKYRPYHPTEHLLTDISIGIRTQSSLRNFCAFSSFVSIIEPKNHLEALDDPKLGFGYGRRTWSI